VNKIDEYGIGQPYSLDELGLELGQLILHDDHLLRGELQLLQPHLVALLGRNHLRGGRGQGPQFSHCLSGGRGGRGCVLGHVQRMVMVYGRARFRGLQRQRCAAQHSIAAAANAAKGC